MPRILHILKQDHPIARDIISQQAQEADVEVVLIQDATTVVMEDVPIFALAEDASDKSRCPWLSYSDLLEKIFSADIVVTW